MLGGMSADYEPLTTVYNLDVTSAKFIKKASMRHERLMDGGMFMSKDGYVYVTNGCYSEFTSERYYLAGNRWDLIPSFSLVSNHKPINEWVGCLKP